MTSLLLATAFVAVYTTLHARIPAGRAWPGPYDSLLVKAERRLRAEETRLIAFRRDLHQNPEISGKEERTAGRVAARLRELGIEVRTGVGGHGVIGIIRGARPGPIVAYRADMDAVPSNAPDPVEFKSLIPGVRHICGHDVHTTIGVAIAEGLAGLRGELAGTIMLVFQPAEENVEGAKAMLADGLFSGEKPVALYGVHTAPMPVGQLGTRPGPMMSAIDRIRVDITGSDDLAAAADSAQKIINAQSTTTFQEAIAGNSADDAVLAQAAASPGEGGGRSVRGSLHSADAARRAEAKQRIVAAIEALRSTSVDVKITYDERIAAGVTNDAGLTERANAAIQKALGEGTVVTVPPAPPVFSEDYGFLQDVVPGVFWFLGVSNPAKGTVGMPHNPSYVADEGAILVAARAMTAVMLDRLDH